MVSFALLGISRWSPKNRTFDDKHGDSVTGMLPTYLPANQWVQGEEYTVCLDKLDSSRVFLGSWQDTTALLNGDVEPCLISMKPNGKFLS